MDRFNPFLGNIDTLFTTTQGEKKEYVQPRLKNLGSVSLVLIREAIAPVVFRNSEEEITDIEINSDAYVRAVPNKFKYPERGRGLQILRLFKAGGKMPQNKIVLTKKMKPSEGFDLNSLVFGDSTVWDSNVLPVKAAVNYSDALSVLPKHLCVDKSFHNRAMEDGTLFDAETKKNSDNLFNRHFVKPGTLLVQVISTRGCLLPRIGLDHLLLSVGVAGTYGGQTSVTGTNILTHIAGIYGGRFEQPETSPYRIVQMLGNTVDNPLFKNVQLLSAHLHERLSKAHEVAMNFDEVGDYQQKLVKRFESDAQQMETDYQQAAAKIGQFFDQWFSGK
ncbi:CRISPR-associated protein Csc2 [Candidatus Thiomargarita nelsonii]|uniref:CRISPR-associated protein Csc2 n=1 Tax=Candidatus Thiomargarita nelsonii TaxID=1003181 RepID=A0A4E0QM65_9GAMM|nr:CRISPR-associated protein Csc2 [Candidatus Thiomargarita nelsonii]